MIEIPEQVGGIPQEQMMEQTPVPVPYTIEEVGECLSILLKNAKDEDKTVRQQYLLLWRQLEYYWNNILDAYMFGDDWRVPTAREYELDSELPPRLINIYRPHGEAIVAALSVDVPNIFFRPDDADNPNDIETAKAMRSIVEFLQLHNSAPMMLIRMLVIMFNQGTVYGYNYYMQDPKRGTISSPRVESIDVNSFTSSCTVCGAPLDGGIGQPQEMVYECPTCGNVGPAEVNILSEKMPQIVGYDETPKGMVQQEIFSGLNVKVSSYATKQINCGYLLLEFVQSTAMIQSLFNDKKIQSSVAIEWENFVKIPINYFGQMPDKTCNVSCIWFRSWQFYQLGEDQDKIDFLLKIFPEGCYAIFVNDTFMAAYPEAMDDHWTITENPMGNVLIAKPLGENLSTVQDIESNLLEIEIQTAEFGIPETFVDPTVLDMEKYGQGRSKPGMMTAAKPKSGKSISDAFHTTKPAILSQEVDPLFQRIEQLGQMVVGSFPSVFGGPATGGSKTASEYSQSRAIALQRLGTTWKIVTDFWAKFMSRSAIEYANVLKELGTDEKFTKRVDRNDFVNVWIRHTSLSGKIGQCEPESSEQLPVSWAQKKEQIERLIATNNEQILMLLAHPRNTQLVQDATGLKDLYIPGAEDRVRQFREFNLLSQGVPVPTRPLIDNDEIHIEVLKTILEGSEGEDLPEEILQVCYQHIMEHEFNIAQKAVQMQASAPGGNENAE